MIVTCHQDHTLFHEEWASLSRPTDISHCVMRLHIALALLAPFALVALFHHIRFASTSMQVPALSSVRRGDGSSSVPGLSWGAPLPGITIADQLTQDLPQSDDDDEADALAVLGVERSGGALVPVAAGADVEEPQEVGMPVAQQQVQELPQKEHKKEQLSAANARDVSASYPAPVPSDKTLLDGSQNWLPVADAEADEPSDLAWRRAIPTACRPNVSGGNVRVIAAGDADDAVGNALKDHPLFSRLYRNTLATTVPKEYAAGREKPRGCTCPHGRRPYHTILTAQASTYQRWQTLIVRPRPTRTHRPTP